MAKEHIQRFMTAPYSKVALWAAAGRLLVPAIWMGLLIGISFIEAPLKFTAPGITIPLGLGIGQLVFTAMNYVEMALFVVLVLSSVKRGVDQRFWTLIAGLGVVLAAKVVVIRPLLAQRTDAVLAGLESGGSITHYFYIAADGIIFVLLIMALVMGARRWILPGR